MAKAKKKAQKNPTLRERVGELERDAQVTSQLLQQHARDWDRHRTLLKAAGENLTQLTTRVARLEEGAAPRTKTDAILGFDLPPAARLSERMQSVAPRERFKEAVLVAKRNGFSTGQMVHWLSEDSKT